MKPFDYIKTAFKNLWRQKLRTTLTIFAIVIGAVSVTVMLSLVFAGQKAFYGSLESSGALRIVTVLPSNQADNENSDLFQTSWNTDSKNKLDDKTVEKVSTINHVDAATPVLAVSGNAVKLAGQAKQFNAQIIGVDVSKNVFNINLLSGRALIPTDTRKIVISDSLMGDLGYKGKPNEVVGKQLLMLTKGWGGVPLSEPDPQKPPRDQKEFEAYNKELQEKDYEIAMEIIGVMQSGSAGDSSIVTLDYAKELSMSKYWGHDQKDMDEFNKQNEEFQKLQQEQMNQQNQQNFQNKNGRNNKPVTQTELPNPPQFPEMRLLIRDSFQDRGYGSIMLKVDDTKSLSSVVTDVEKLELKTVTAEKMIEEFTRIFTVIGSVLAGIGSISLFVASIGIINTMIMATYERTKEIGVLRACGAKRATIRRLFMFESALLGFFGGLVGLGISFLLSLLGNQIIDQIAKEESLPLEGIVSLPLWLSLGVVGFTTIIGMLAGLYPAFRAARLDPISALRYE